MSVDITAEQFLRERGPRPGNANPELMRAPLWEAMIRSGSGPWVLRERFGLPDERTGPGDPDWCFDRFGQTVTELADGRVISIAGEHEDSYDTDFCIYNDVVVRFPNDEIEIYGYPHDVFSPTDFHTTTVLGERALVLGCLGYSEHQDPDKTPARWLDLATYEIRPVNLRGDGPGWLSRHHSTVENGALIVEGGEVCLGGDRPMRENVEVWRLDLSSMQFSCISNHRWPQFALGREDRKILNTWSGDRRRDESVGPDQLFDLPEVRLLSQPDAKTREIGVGESIVRLKLGPLQLRVLVRGQESARSIDQLLQQLCRNLQEAEAAPIRVEQVGP